MTDPIFDDSWRDRETHRGYVVRDLDRAFDLVAPSPWKGPIDAEISAEAREITAAAIAFHTGSIATFAPLPNGRLRVTAAGYYAAIGP